MKNSTFLKCSFVNLLVLLMLSGTLIAQSEIVYVYDETRTNILTGENPDLESTGAVLEEAGYLVTPFPVISLSTATQDQLDQLNSADLVYIGRAVASTNFQDANKTFWNEITAPVMTANMWALRNSRMNWFNSADCANIDDPALEDVLDAEILEIDDPVFKDLNGETFLGWWSGPYSTIAAADGGNGLVLAVELSTMYPIFVRWDAEYEFYDGSGDMPFGPRTFFGLGNDNPRDADGNAIYNYMSYTDEAMTVFLNEVAYLTGNLVVDHTFSKEFGLNVSVNFNQSSGQLVVKMDGLAKVEVLDLVGRHVYSGVATDKRLSTDLGFVKQGIYLVKISDKDNHAVTKKIIKG